MSSRILDHLFIVNVFPSQNECKAQVWAFLLWKCSSVRDGSTVNTDNSWKLYQQWCRMAEAQRTAWITAGSNVQALSKFAHAKVVSYCFLYNSSIFNTESRHIVQNILSMHSIQMELKTEDQLVPVQAPVQQEVKKRGRPRKLAKTVCSYCSLITLCSVHFTFPNTHC